MPPYQHDLQRNHHAGLTSTLQSAHLAQARATAVVRVTLARGVRFLGRHLVPPGYRYGGSQQARRFRRRAH